MKQTEQAEIDLILVQAMDYLALLARAPFKDVPADTLELWAERLSGIRDHALTARDAMTAQADRAAA